MSRCFAYKGSTEQLKPIADLWANEAESSFGLELVADAHVKDLQTLVDSDMADLLVLDQDGEITGYLGIQIFKNPLGEQLIANEHYWFVIPECRGLSAMRLIKAAKVWAKEKGCSHLIMNASKLASELHDKVCKVYERQGMKHFETSYIMEI